MKTKIKIRGLLIATVLSEMASVVAYHLERNSLPIELRMYLRSWSKQLLLDHYSMISAVTLAYEVIYVTSFVGLFFFWRPARLLYCGLILVNLFMIPVSGPYVTTTWQALFSDCVGILMGVILCLIFVSPFREEFTKKPEA